MIERYYTAAMHTPIRRKAFRSAEAVPSRVDS
jgi:hypothetical protein